MPTEENALRRREFLARAASLAGMAGAASLLPADTILNEVALANRTALPSSRNLPIDHFVVVMMENRSFDHYFGWLGDVADATQEATYVDGTGTPHTTQHASTLEAEYQGCGHPDPGHGWNSGRRQLQGGFMADGSGNDRFALTYYDEDELQFIHAAGKE